MNTATKHDVEETRHCQECELDYPIDVTKKEEVEIEEFSNCYQHLKTVDELKEECFTKIKDVYYWKRKARAWEELHDVHEKEDAERIAALKARIAELENGLDTLQKALIELRGM